MAYLARNLNTPGLGGLVAGHKTNQRATPTAIVGGTLNSFVFRLGHRFTSSNKIQYHFFLVTLDFDDFLIAFLIPAFLRSMAI
jgi:hypothetical protein